MAELDVQPKRSSPWWVWLLLAVVAAAVVVFLLKGRNSNTAAVTTKDSTSSTTVAVTKPDWNTVDFNSAKLADADVTDTGIVVSGNDHYTIYTLGENILFATDQSKLQGSAGDKLKQVAASLNKRFKNSCIGVYGSTDSTGMPGHNRLLGSQRAAAVKEWLVKNGGLDSSKVSVHSLGETRPVASNASASGRRQNRNVSIVAFPNK